MKSDNNIVKIQNSFERFCTKSREAAGMLFTEDHSIFDKMPETHKDVSKNIDTRFIKMIERFRLNLISKSSKIEEIKDIYFDMYDVIEKDYDAEDIKKLISEDLQIDPNSMRTDKRIVTAGEYNENGYLRIYPIGSIGYYNKFKKGEVAKARKKNI